MAFNLADIQETIAAAVPDRPALIFRDRRYSFADMTRRTRQFANFLLSVGISKPTPRAHLQNWQSGQDHVALYLQNGNEYPEAMYGAIKAGAASFNVNYRYVAEELRYLFNNADSKVIVFHAQYAPLLKSILSEIPAQKALIQVADDSDEPLLDGAIYYEDALAAASADRPDVDWSPDDLYILYTGGTTGMPKGVLWRQQDILTSALGGRTGDGAIIESLDQYAERAMRYPPRRYLPTPPFMHGTAQWIALTAWHNGNTVVIQDHVDRYDPAELLDVIAREKVNALSLVGDAFGRPFIQALDETPHDTSSLSHILNGGAAMSPSTKAALLERLPGLKLIDTIGSSEAGPMARHVASSAGTTSTTPKSVGGSNVLNDTLTKLEQPGHAGLGWLAATGPMPLGYLGDEAKTKATFPVIDGVRYSVPGDRARLLEDGSIEFHGRDSVSINTGGEKVFAEEVERAIGQHPDVADVLVSWRPSERWGQEVIAVVQLSPGAAATKEEMLAKAGLSIARYKLPKAIILVDKVQRHDNGKPDYRWAKKIADEAV